MVRSVGNNSFLRYLGCASVCWGSGEGECVMDHGLEFCNKVQKHCASALYYFATLSNQYNVHCTSPFWSGKWQKSCLSTSVGSLYGNSPYFLQCMCFKVKTEKVLHFFHLHLHVIATLVACKYVKVHVWCTWGYYFFCCLEFRKNGGKRFFALGRPNEVKVGHKKKYKMA